MNTAATPAADPAAPGTHVCTAVSADEKAQAAAASAPALPYTLHFIRWECGHHQAKPADIPCATPQQALLILQALGAAISQPGSARAVLFDDTTGIDAYVTDDYATLGISTSEHDLNPATWADRPLVIHGDADTIARIHAPALADARDWVLGIDDCHPWDGKKPLEAFGVATTTLTREAVEELLANAEELDIGLCELPPVFRPAAEVLAELQEHQGDFADDGRDELLAVVRMVANLGEYRQLVERMADCLRPHERPAFERLFRQDARAALFAAGEPR